MTTPDSRAPAAVLERLRAIPELAWIGMFIACAGILFGLGTLRNSRRPIVVSTVDHYTATAPPGNSSGSVTGGGATSTGTPEAAAQQSTAGATTGGDGAAPPAIIPTSWAVPPGAHWTSFTQGQDLTLDYPPGWIVQIVRPGPVGRTQINAPSPDSRIVIDVDSQKDRDPMVDCAYWNRLFQKKYGNKYQLISMAPTSIGGLRSATWIFHRQRDDGGWLTLHESYIHSHGKLFTVLLRCPSQEYDAAKDTRDHVVSSIRFTD